MVQGMHDRTRHGCRLSRSSSNLIGYIMLLSLFGCRSADCETCNLRSGPSTYPRNTAGTVGLPGTPTLPPTTNATVNSSLPSSPSRATELRQGTPPSGLAPTLPTTASGHRTPTLPNIAGTHTSTSSATQNAMSNSSVPNRLPSPADLTPTSGNATSPSTPSSTASSNWMPAAPLAPTPPNLSDPGPLPPPPPGSAANAPVLPPVPPPTSLSPQ